MKNDEGKASATTDEHFDIRAGMEAIKLHREEIQRAQDAEKKIAAWIFAALENGQSTDDEVLDMVLWENNGRPSDDLKAKYDKVIDLLKGRKGEYILVVVAKEESPGGCSPLRESRLEFTAKLGILSGEALIFGSLPKRNVEFPTNGYHWMLLDDSGGYQATLYVEGNLSLGTQWSFDRATISEFDERLNIENELDRHLLYTEDAVRLRIIVGNGNVRQWSRRFQHGSLSKKLAKIEGSLAAGTAK